MVMLYTVRCLVQYVPVPNAATSPYSYLLCVGNVPDLYHRCSMIRVSERNGGQDTVLSSSTHKRLRFRATSMLTPSHFVARDFRVEAVVEAFEALGPAKASFLQKMQA